MKHGLPRTQQSGNMSIAPDSITSVGGGSGATDASAVNGSMQNFESFYHSICTDLQNKGEVHSVSKKFEE